MQEEPLDCCTRFGDCGGCATLDQPYRDQLAQKEQYLREVVAGAGYNASRIETIRGMTHPYRYRNKMEFTFSTEGVLGLNRPGHFASIVPLDHCLLCSESMEAVYHLVQAWNKKWKLPGYNKRNHGGLLRHLAVRQSYAYGGLMVVLFTAEAGDGNPEVEAAVLELADQLQWSQLPIDSAMWAINADRADKAQFTRKPRVLFGIDHILDELAGFRYELHLDTFFQVNGAQAEVLMDAVLEMTAGATYKLILDVYCGVGSLSLPLARNHSPANLVGIEIVPQAISSARENASRNQMDNVDFVLADARRGIPQVIDRWGQPDCIVLDPPRSGAGGKVMRRIGRTGPERVVYISCNPESLVDDLQRLSEFGYEIQRMIPVDMFPHTPHVETVVLMSRDEDGKDR